MSEFLLKKGQVIEYADESGTTSVGVNAFKAPVARPKRKSPHARDPPEISRVQRDRVQKDAERRWQKSKRRETVIFTSCWRYAVPAMDENTGEQVHKPPKQTVENDTRRKQRIEALNEQLSPNSCGGSGWGKKRKLVEDSPSQPDICTPLPR